MAQTSWQKNRRFKKKLLSYLTCFEIWLNFPMYHCPCGTTQMSPIKKKKTLHAHGDIDTPTLCHGHVLISCCNTTMKMSRHHISI